MPHKKEMMTNNTLCNTNNHVLVPHHTVVGRQCCHKRIEALWTQIWHLEHVTGRVLERPVQCPMHVGLVQVGRVRQHVDQGVR